MNLQSLFWWGSRDVLFQFFEQVSHSSQMLKQKSKDKFIISHVWDRL